MIATSFHILKVTALRTWKKTLRRPVLLTFSLVQPLMWMLFFGFLFQRYALAESGTQIAYLDFLLPGVCVMTVLFGASQSGVGFIRDMQTGFLSNMLQTPASRGLLLAGKISADVSRLLLQSTIVCLLGLLLGAKLQVNMLSLLPAIAGLAFFAIAYASLSCFIALRTKTQEVMAAFTHVVNMPVLFTSTALVPSKNMPGWLEQIAKWNPLTLAVDLLRDALLFNDPETKWVSFLTLGILAMVLWGMAKFALERAGNS